MNLELQRQQEYESQRLDQLPTYEVFLQMKHGKSYEHVGIVHAATADMAFIFGKEQFSRRYTCTGMWVVPSHGVWVTECTELEENVYDHIADFSEESDELEESYEIFHLSKRGKQHKHAGQVWANSHSQALIKAKHQFDHGKPVLNIWAIKTKDIKAIDEEDQVIWSTLPEKNASRCYFIQSRRKVKSI